MFGNGYYGGIVWIVLAIALICLFHEGCGCR